MVIEDCPVLDQSEFAVGRVALAKLLEGQ